MERLRGLPLLALFALGDWAWSGAAPSLGDTPAGLSLQPPSFAYLIEQEGLLTKVDLSLGRVVYRRSIPASVLGGGAQESRDYQRGVEGAALDESTASLIVVIADSAFTEDRPDRSFHVIRLALPDLEPADSFAIPLRQERTPSLLIDPHRSRVLVQWEDLPLRTDSGTVIEWRYRISALGLPGLDELRRWSGVRDTDASGSKPFPWFFHGPWLSLTPEAVIGPDSMRITHFRGSLYFTADSFTGRYDQLDVSPELEAALRRGLRLAPQQGRTSFGYPLPIDARGGRILWKSWSDSTNPRFDVLLTSGDLASSPEAVWSVPWSAAWLLPAGRTVVVQEIEGPPGAGTTALRKVGRLTFYDSRTAQQRYSVSIPELGGAYESVQFLCASADEEYLLFRSAGGQVYSIRAGAKRASPRPIQPVTTVSLSAGCFPSER